MCRDRRGQGPRRSRVERIAKDGRAAAQPLVWAMISGFFRGKEIIRQMVEIGSCISTTWAAIRIGGAVAEWSKALPC